MNQYPTTVYINKLYKKYLPVYGGKKKDGLFLLPLQTGSGKTHATAKVIVDIIKNHPKQKVIYVIHTKTNRDDIYNKIKDELQDDILLDKEVITLKSQEDIFRDFFLNLKFKNISMLEQIDEFDKLQKKFSILLKISVYDNLYDIYKEEDNNFKN
jgi:superfamily II DNA or RNA helicase